MYDYIIPEYQFIEQAKELLNLIIPELSQGVIIDVLSINIFNPIDFFDPIINYESIEITHSSPFVKKYMPKSSVINLMKDNFNGMFPELFYDYLANYFDTKDGVSCRVCSLISKSETIFKYVIVLFKLEYFNKIVENVYFDTFNGKRIYIFIETLLRNIIYNAQRNISRIAYPQIARDIVTHSVDYVLCRNLDLPHQDIFILLSSLYYEGNPINAKIVQISPLLNYNKIVKLDKSIGLYNKDVHTIRKLLELSRQGCVLVLNGWDIVAITKQEYLKDIPYLSIEFLGHMHWQLCISEKTIFRYQNGSYYISNGHKSKDYYKNSLLKCFNKIGCESVDALSTVIELASMQKHGTSIIVTEEAKDETERLCLLNRGIKIEELELNKNAEIILALTAIDGAVILDLECKCYGIGLILDGEAICIGDPSRGARYNSIVNYIEIKKKMGKQYMAFIISEDGIINIVD